MEFKYLFKKIILENDKIIFKRLFEKRIILFDEITHIQIETPKYNTLNTGQLDFSVYFYTFKTDNKLIKYNIVLLEDEIKQLQNFLEAKHISNSQKTYDNKLKEM